MYKEFYESKQAKKFYKNAKLFEERDFNLQRTTAVMWLRFRFAQMLRKAKAFLYRTSHNRKRFVQ